MSRIHDTLVAGLLVMACAFGQQEAKLEVVGVPNPLTLTAQSMAGMPRAKASIDHENVITEFEGVWLDEILAKAGAPLGGSLRGKALAGYLLADAGDGYRVVFSLAEVDPAFSENRVLVADKARGEPLVGSQGPFRLVVTNDKRPARSMRMVQRIELVLLRK